MTLHPTFSTLGSQAPQATAPTLCLELSSPGSLAGLSPHSSPNPNPACSEGTSLPTTLLTWPPHSPSPLLPYTTSRCMERSHLVTYLQEHSDGRSMRQRLLSVSFI